jgi:hypothetical protein
MHRHIVSLLVVVATALIASGQTERPLEIGTQFTLLRISSPGEIAGSVGGRASYDLHFASLTLAPEAEFNYFPQSPSNAFVQTQLLAGVRAGFVVGRVGFFLKARPGLVHLAGNDFKELNSASSTNPAFDLGGVFEYYTSERVVLRFDYGDTMIRFPQFAPAFVPPPKAGWHNNLQVALGLSFRF